MDSQIIVKTKKGDLKLVRQDLIEGRVSMRFPETFQDIPENLYNTTIINGQKIDISKSNEERTVVFSMLRKALDDKPISSEEKYIKTAVGGFRAMFPRLVPGYQEIGIFAKEVSEHLVGCINYYSYGLDLMLFHVFALFISGRELCQCEFTCSEKDAAEWNLIFLTCIDSLIIIDEK